ncbi:MAG: DUF692 family protein [Myxococcales bacterium]|nr:DUF692 family protein [Myxococcales bacterium]
MTGGEPGSGRLGLGVGVDMPWGSQAIGFDVATGGPTERLARYLGRERFAYLMFSFQPRGCAALDLETYLPAYQRLRESAPPGTPMVLHQTMLNFGATHHYDRSEVYAFTNALHRRLGLLWVVEDVGIWSYGGIPMPYPLPPFLTEQSLAHTVESLRRAKDALEPRLQLEFPGFTDGYSIVVGQMDAYDWFREVVERADVAVTLDVGHLLSYRWLRGHAGEALYEGLERLPLHRCREIHLSGCAIRRGRFLDLHHGVLLDEQLELLDRLLERCPALQGVTYEDPAIDSEGRLPPKAVRNVERLRARVERWTS